MYATVIDMFYEHGNFTVPLSNFMSRIFARILIKFSQLWFAVFCVAGSVLLPTLKLQAHRNVVESCQACQRFSITEASCFFPSKFWQNAFFCLSTDSGSDSGEVVANAGDSTRYFHFDGTRYFNWLPSLHVEVSTEFPSLPFLSLLFPILSPLSTCFSLFSSISWLEVFKNSHSAFSLCILRISFLFACEL